MKTQQAIARSEKINRGFAGLILISVVVVMVAASIARFLGAFESTEPVTVISKRVGLVTDVGGKVSARGVQIGRIKEIRREPNRSVILLKVRRSELRSIPENANVHIASNTMFGAKSIDFTMPESPSPQSLRSGAVVSEASVTTEVNTLFQRLTDILQTIQPEKLNATLGGLSGGLAGRGDKLGATIDDLNGTLKQINPTLDTLQRDLENSSYVSGLYADIADNLMALLDSSSDVGQTIVSRQAKFEALLANAITAGDSGKALLNQNGDDVIKLVRDLRITTSLAAEYSPALNCMIIGLNQGRLGALQSFGAKNQPGLSFLAGFQQGAKPYEYPNDLPKVNSKSGPQCFGMPFPERGKHAPFLVTDNGSNTMEGQPNTFANTPRLGVGPSYPPGPGAPPPPSILEFMLGNRTAQYAAPTDKVDGPVAEKDLHGPSAESGGAR